MNPSIRRKQKLVPVLCTLACIAVVCAGLNQLRLSAIERAERKLDAAMLDTIQAAEPIVEAIERYEAERLRPPDSLESLSPRYLRYVPEAATARERQWYYSPYNKESPEQSGGDRWVLGIEVSNDRSPNRFGFGDYLVYQPKSNYPAACYGGMLWKRYGKWAYYLGW